MIDELLPCCGQYPGPKSVIVMDNVAFHSNPSIKEAIEAAGCEVRLLPPYSPDFNSIELTFSVLKVWVKRHFHSTWEVDSTVILESLFALLLERVIAISSQKSTSNTLEEDIYEIDYRAIRNGVS